MFRARAQEDCGFDILRLLPSNKYSRLSVLWWVLEHGSGSLNDCLGPCRIIVIVWVMGVIQSTESLLTGKKPQNIKSTIFLGLGSLARNIGPNSEIHNWSTTITHGSMQSFFSALRKQVDFTQSYIYIRRGADKTSIVYYYISTYSSMKSIDIWVNTAAAGLLSTGFSVRSSAGISIYIVVGDAQLVCYFPIHFINDPQ